MVHYVLGFAFDTAKTSVLLIEKKKPKWQEGLLNGVGGKIEPGEGINEAMAREFYEETSILTHPGDWKCFAKMQGPDWDCHCFKAFKVPIRSHKRPTDEHPLALFLDDLDGAHYVSNIPWLIQMALDMNGHSSDNTFFATITYI